MRVVGGCVRLLKVHPHPLHRFHVSSHCTTTTSPPGDSQVGCECSWSP